MNAVHEMRYEDMVAELEELRAWKQGRKGVEDYFELQAKHQELNGQFRKIANQWLDLYTKYCLQEDRCNALELSTKKLAEENENLKAHLGFYATEENYKAQLVAPDLVIIPVCDDRGEIARAVLGVALNDTKEQVLRYEPKDSRPCCVCGKRADEHPWINDPRGGKRRGKCPGTEQEQANG